MSLQKSTTKTQRGQREAENIPQPTITFDDSTTMGYEVSRWRFWAMLIPMYLMVVESAVKTIFFILIGKREDVKRGLRPCHPSVFWSGLSSACCRVMQTATSAHALDIVYNYLERVRPRLRGLDFLVSDFWLYWIMINPGAVRNRLRLAEREIWDEVCLVYARKARRVEMLSVGSGTAQGVIEVLAKCKTNDIPIRAVLFDRDEAALALSARLAKSYGVDNMIETKVGATRGILNILEGRRFDFVEMIGFLDYRPESSALRLMARIRSLMNPGAVFLASNICPNPEKQFMNWVVRWPMVYRKPTELGQLMVKVGFCHVRIVVEPQKVHAISISA